MKSRDGEDKAILWEDSTEDEVTFKTPPNTVKSSQLKRTTSGSLKIDLDESVNKDPKQKKQSPKEKLKKKNVKTPEVKTTKSVNAGQKAKLRSVKLKSVKSKMKGKK